MEIYSQKSRVVAKQLEFLYFVEWPTTGDLIIYSDNKDNAGI